jgi:hypothetical protein
MVNDSRDYWDSELCPTSSISGTLKNMLQKIHLFLSSSERVEDICPTSAITNS